VFLFQGSLEKTVRMQPLHWPGAVGQDHEGFGGFRKEGADLDPAVDAVRPEYAERVAVTGADDRLDVAAEGHN
jgi:hypothetical protein